MKQSNVMAKSPDILMVEAQINKLNLFISAQMAKKKANRDHRGVKSAYEAIPRLKKWLEELDLINKNKSIKPNCKWNLSINDNITPKINGILDSIKRFAISIGYDIDGKMQSVSLVNPNDEQSDLLPKFDIRHVTETIVGSKKFDKYISENNIDVSMAMDGVMTLGDLKIEGIKRVESTKDLYDNMGWKWPTEDGNTSPVGNPNFCADYLDQVEDMMDNDLEQIITQIRNLCHVIINENLSNSETEVKTCRTAQFILLEASKMAKIVGLKKRPFLFQDKGKPFEKDFEFILPSGRYITIQSDPGDEQHDTHI